MYLENLKIENEQALKQAEIYSEVFSGLMDARASIVNNNMSQLMKKLTIINTNIKSRLHFSIHHLPKY